MSRKIMERVSAEQKPYFWLEIEMLPTDNIVRLTNGGRLRTMIYPKGTVGQSMEFKLESDFLRLETEKGKMKRGWPCGFVRIARSDLSLLRHYLGLFKGTGRKFATSIHLNGTL